MIWMARFCIASICLLCSLVRAWCQAGTQYSSTALSVLFYLGFRITSKQFSSLVSESDTFIGALKIVKPMRWHASHANYIQGL